MGHLFVLPIGDFRLSIRMAIWIIIMITFSTTFIKQLFVAGIQSQYRKRIKAFSLRKYFGLFAIFIFIGLGNAFLRGNEPSLIFSDFNAWLYWFLLFPLIAVYGEKNEMVLKNLKNVFLAAAIFLSLKTIFLLFVFTHNLNCAPEIYSWLRRTLVGEMTPTLSGWPRIFIQGQIFSGLALFLVFWFNLKQASTKIFHKQNVIYIFLAALFFSSILISFSRSFWVALSLTIIFNFLIVWRLYSWRKALATNIWLGGSLLMGLLLIYLVAIFPYPAPGKFNADFIGRVANNNEPALASRWSLLPILAKEIGQEPFLGQGYGKTITYISQDPRVLEKNKTGEYTTYAFEWGYLDLWLKIGLFGLLSYLILIIYLIRAALKYGNKNNDFILLGLSSGIVFLAITNIFTPYLNHPLGIGILLVSACLIQKDKVY
jgi:O-antigen ligase